MRLDKTIQQKFNLKSRTYAENLILTEHVQVDGKIVKKPSFDVGENADIIIINDENFASQGAYKLEEAFELFRLDANEKSCLDVGCSNGGFSDVLLRHGAKSIVALDVADCALPQSLLDSGKIEFLRANILAEIFRVLKKGGEAVVLVKPQFELDKSALDKNGIVKTEKLRQKALLQVTEFAKNVGFEIKGTGVAPIRYQNKNIEYLLYLKK